MAKRNEETIELESQPLNTEKKAEIFTSVKTDQPQKEKLTPIGLTKEELMKYAKDPFWCKLRKTLFVLFWLLWVLMFVGAFFIIHYVPSCPATSRLKWYQKEPTAQIDLEKVFKNKFSMLADPNNIDPFMKTFQARTLLLPNLFSSNLDNIVDHLELNTELGSQEELSKALQYLKVNHATNVIMDFNAATTSRDHKWFKSFLAQEGKYANYYLIADSEYSDYINYSTETLNNGKGALITKNKKPVLNLSNEDVRAEFRAIFDKWGRLNIKGYRLLGAPYLLVDPESKRVLKSVELNKKLIKEWTKDLRHSVSDGVLILQLDDQDAESYADYYGTQEDPIADIVVNKFVSRLDLRNSTSEIKDKLTQYINGTKKWNDELNNIGPWTGWLVEDLNEVRRKEDLLVCFSNILAYTLPRGVPLTRISERTLHIGIPSLFFKTLREQFNDIEKYGTFDNARLFSKLANLRKEYADSIMLGSRTEFLSAKVDGNLDNDVFVMLRSNDKEGIIVIANLKNEPKDVVLDLELRHPRTANVAASCKIKEGHLFGAKLNLEQSINLKSNETLVATFDLMIQ